MAKLAKLFRCSAVESIIHTNDYRGVWPLGHVCRLPTQRVEPKNAGVLRTVLSG